MTPILIDKKCNEVSAGANFSLFILDDHHIYSCGAEKGIGNGKIGDIFKPTIIKELETIPISCISAGYMHSACTDQMGKLYSWGDNSVYQLGHSEEKKLVL